MLIDDDEKCLGRYKKYSALMKDVNHEKEGICSIDLNGACKRCEI